MVDTSGLLLPEGACLLHVGPYKTGSTAIQAALHQARDEMRGYGVVYPGSGTRDRRAGWALLQGVPRGRRSPRMDDWNALVRQVQASRDQRVCVSNEDFGHAAPRFAARIVTELGADRVHVVAVARRFDKLLPSQWQQRIKSHRTYSYEEFLSLVLDDPTARHQVCRFFWGSHDVEAMVGRWAPLVGDRLTLILTDDSDRGQLPGTFEQMLGLPPGLLKPGPRSNPSLTMNQVELLRRVNQAFVDNAWSDVAYHRLIQSGLQRTIHAASAGEHNQPIPPLPGWAAERVAELSAKRVETIKSLGVRLVGDPDCLYTEVPSTLAVPDTPPESISIEAAALAVEGVVRGALDYEARSTRRHERALERAARRAGTRNVDNASGRELLGALSKRVVRKFARPLKRG